MAQLDSDPSLKLKVAAFRRFNRWYTRFLGVLDEEWLKGGVQPDGGSCDV
jgi:hypothetical protein